MPVAMTITDYFLGEGGITPRDALDTKLKEFVSAKENPKHVGALPPEPSNSEIKTLAERKVKAVKVALNCAERANPGEEESDSPLRAKAWRVHNDALEPVRAYLAKPGPDTVAACQQAAKNRQGKPSSTYGPDKVVYYALMSAASAAPSTAGAHARQSAKALARVLDDRNKQPSGSNLPLVLGICQAGG